MSSNMQRVARIHRDHVQGGTGGSFIRKVASDLGVSYHHARKMIHQWKTIMEAKRVEVPANPKDPLFRSGLLRQLKQPRTTTTIAKNLGVNEKDIEEAISDLEESGYIIHRKGRALQLGRTVREAGTSIRYENHRTGKPISFGVIADMHMASKSERLDVLRDAYAEFERRGISVVLCPGNYVDGECRFNSHELKVHGLADQCQYAIDNWPHYPGVTTYFIDGDDHEGWYQQREGIEFGRYLMLEAREQGRDDLVYLGYMEADFILEAPQGEAVIKLIHAGGGSSYAFSYAAQKLAESFQGGEKPAVAIIGHYHKLDYSFPRSVHCVQAGCAQDQTRFMRKRKLSAHVGFCVITLEQDIFGSITRFVPEFYPYWDRRYYLRRDSGKVSRKLGGKRKK